MLKDRLIKLHRENVVKNQPLRYGVGLCQYLIQKGYEVQVEYPLNASLTCDLFGIEGLGNLVVEIETGFIPPETRWHH